MNTKAVIAEFDYVPRRVKIDCYCDYTLDKAYPLPSIYVYLQLNNDAYVHDLVTSETLSEYVPL